MITLFAFKTDTETCNCQNMHSRHQAVNGGGRGQPAGINREEMKKKISFGWHHILLIHLLLGVGLGTLADLGGDIYSSYELHVQYAGSHSSNTTLNVTRQQEGNLWHYPFSICLLFIPRIIVMSLSLITYWREEKEKLTLLRWACHIPIFFAAPIVRYLPIQIH